MLAVSQDGYMGLLSFGNNELVNVCCQGEMLEGSSCPQILFLGWGASSWPLWKTERGIRWAICLV